MKAGFKGLGHYDGIMESTAKYTDHRVNNNKSKRFKPQQPDLKMCHSSSQAGGLRGEVGRSQGTLMEEADTVVGLLLEQSMPKTQL